MLNRVMVLVALLGTSGSAALAADNKPADAKPGEASERAAAMERAQRMAANPMRVILQASKVRRRAANEPDSNTGGPNASAPAPAPAAAPAVPSRAQVADGAAAVRAAALAAVQSATAAPSAASVAAPMAGPLIAPTAAPAASPGLTPPAESAPALTGPLAVSAASPALPKPAQVAVPPAQAGVAATTATTAAMSAGSGVLAAPKLRTLVEPSIPARLLSDLGKIDDIQADLTIRADGSVAAVRLVQPVPRQLTRYLLAAFEAWRFEPLPAQREHRVQLVFGDN